jgi:DnaD/phage-associated family protein
MMNFNPNPAVFTPAFAVPCCVADEHLKLAGAVALKVLLLFLRSGGLPPEELAEKCGQPISEILDALHFWVQRGVLTVDGFRLPADCAVAIDKNTIPVAAAVSPQADGKGNASRFFEADDKKHREEFTESEILARTKESPELGELFQVAQKILGRTLGFRGEVMLLELHDTCGLPTEVLAMLLQYCANAGKTANNYITEIGKRWGEREIDTIEKAEGQIRYYSEISGVWREIAKAGGYSANRPTEKQAETIRVWREDYGFSTEMILLAYEEAQNRTGKLSFAYMDKILRNWKDADVKTPEQIAAYYAATNAPRRFTVPSAQAKGNGSKVQSNDEPPPSYDLDAFIQATQQVPLSKRLFSKDENE